MIAPEDEVLSTIIATPKPARDNRNSLGIGVVRMMGPPALTPLRWRECDECGGFGTGPDKIDGPGEVYQDPCAACDGHGARWYGGVEIPPQFKVGDRVRFIGQHASRLGEWDGEPVRFVSQEEVQAVIDDA